MFDRSFPAKNSQELLKYFEAQTARSPNDLPYYQFPEWLTKPDIMVKLKTNYYAVITHYYNAKEKEVNSNIKIIEPGTGQAVREMRTVDGSRSDMMVELDNGMLAVYQLHKKNYGIHIYHPDTGKYIKSMKIAQEIDLMVSNGDYLYVSCRNDSKGVSVYDIKTGHKITNLLDNMNIVSIIKCENNIAIIASHMPVCLSLPLFISAVCVIVNNKNIFISSFKCPDFPSNCSPIALSHGCFVFPENNSINILNISKKPANNSLLQIPFRYLSSNDILTITSLENGNIAVLDDKKFIYEYKPDGTHIRTAITNLPSRLGDSPDRLSVAMSYALLPASISTHEKNVVLPSITNERLKRRENAEIQQLSCIRPGFNMDIYLSLLPVTVAIAKLELNTDKINLYYKSARKQAAKLALTFGSDTHAIEYLKRARKSVQEACSFTLPSDLAWDISQHWRDIINHSKNKPGSPTDLVFRLLEKADKIDALFNKLRAQKEHELREKITNNLKLKGISDEGRINSILAKELNRVMPAFTSHTSLAILKQYASYVEYPGAYENPVVAKVFIDYSISKEIFIKYMKLVPKDDDKAVPPIIIDGSELSEKYNNYLLKKINSADPRAALLGIMTSCCQTLGNEHGDSCVVDGITNPESGFYILVKKPTDTQPEELIVAQSYARRCDDVLLLDSVEHYKYYINDKETLLTDFIMHLAYRLLNKHGIRNVHVGKSRETPGGILMMQAQKLAQSNYAGYSDAKQVQYLLATNDTKIQRELISLYRQNNPKSSIQANELVSGYAIDFYATNGFEKLIYVAENATIGEIRSKISDEQNRHIFIVNNNLISGIVPDFIPFSLAYSHLIKKDISNGETINLRGLMNNSGVAGYIPLQGEVEFRNFTLPHFNKASQQHFVNGSPFEKIRNIIRTYISDKLPKDMRTGNIYIDMQKHIHELYFSGSYYSDELANKLLIMYLSKDDAIMTKFKEYFSEKDNHSRAMKELKTIMDYGKKNKEQDQMNKCHLACLLLDLYENRALETAIESLGEKPPTAALLESIKLNYQSIFHYNKEDQYTLMHCAVLMRNKRIIMQLVKQGENINAVDCRGRTPIFHAKDPATLELLINLGANINAEDNCGENVLFHQITQKALTNAKILIQLGANCDHVNIKTGESIKELIIETWGEKKIKSLMRYAELYQLKARQLPEMIFENIKNNYQRLSKMNEMLVKQSESYPPTMLNYLITELEAIEGEINEHFSKLSSLVKGTVTSSHGLFSICGYA